MPPVAKVFISYRRTPSAMLATLLHEKLKTHNIDAYVDTRRVDGGGPFPNRLLTAIEDCDVFVCLVADTTFDSEWVRTEIEFAYAEGKPLIPVFQESYQPLAKPPTESINALLQSDGIHVLDVKNLYVDQAISDLARMTKTTLGIVVPRPRDTTEMSARTFSLRPRPSRSRWLWPLSALLILLIGFVVFQYVNQPMLDTSISETETAVARAGRATDTSTVTPAPTETLTSTLTDTPEPSETPTPETPVLVIGALGASIRSRPSPADSAIDGVVVSERLPIISITMNGEFYRVDYNGQTAWIQNGPLVRVEGDLSAVPVVSILVISALGANIRSEPSPADSAIDGIVVSERLPITGITRNGDFYRVDYDGESVWVQNGPLVRVEGDLTTVPVVESD